MADLLMCCYHYNMLRKSLIETNPYLGIPEKYRKSLITNVSSSTAIETVTSTETIADLLVKSENTLWAIEVKKPKDSSQELPKISSP